MRLVTLQGAKGPRAGPVLDDARYLRPATAAQKGGMSLDAFSLLAIMQAGADFGGPLPCVTDDMILRPRRPSRLSVL